MILFVSTNIYNIYKNEVNINFIDIGQGDACLIRGKQNNILIDTGGITFGKGDNGKSVLIPYLQKNGVKKLDFVFISHLDADHCKNLSSLSKEVEIKNLFFRKDGYRDFVKKYGEVKAENIYNIENNLKINFKTNYDPIELIVDDGSDIEFSVGNNQKMLIIYNNQYQRSITKRFPEPSEKYQLKSIYIKNGNLFIDTKEKINYKWSFNLPSPIQDCLERLITIWLQKNYT